MSSNIWSRYISKGLLCLDEHASDYGSRPMPKDAATQAAERLAQELRDPQVLDSFLIHVTYLDSTSLEVLSPAHRQHIRDTMPRMEDHAGYAARKLSQIQFAATKSATKSTLNYAISLLFLESGYTDLALRRSSSLPQGMQRKVCEAVMAYRHSGAVDRSARPELAKRYQWAQGILESALVAS